MFLTFLMLGVALSLSAIAAFYSIIGLTAIFAAAAVPVAIMGSILEIAKLTVTVWLHEYWHRCRRLMKWYLVPAVGMLMLITSMGIFGFLSRAHLDQNIISGESTTRIAIFDEKIKSAKDNIETNRRALKQMDDAVEQLMSRTTDEQGATKAANLRRNQQAERTRLQNEIAKEQTKIQQLSEERAPIAAEVRKVEAEVGPIKYIAALIYGDNPDQSLLEKAVRWVIIILVIVFDPLAIFMLLASTESYKWEKYGRSGDPEEHDNKPPQQPVNDAVANLRAQAEGLWSRVKRSKTDANVSTDNLTTEDMAKRSPGDRMDLESVPTVVEPDVSKQRWTREDLPPQKIEYKILGDADEEDLKATPPSVIHLPDQRDDEDLDNEDNAQVKEAKRRWKADNPNDTLKHQSSLFAAGIIDHEPWEDYLEQIKHEMGFGHSLPLTGKKGDQFILTDTLPTRLYKHNGEKWIEIDKQITDQYAYNDAYVDHLIDSISRGNYDPELLTAAERDQIEQRLKRDII